MDFCEKVTDCAMIPQATTKWPSDPKITRMICLLVMFVRLCNSIKFNEEETSHGQTEETIAEQDCLFICYYPSNDKAL